MFLTMLIKVHHIDILAAYLLVLFTNCLDVLGMEKTWHGNFKLLLSLLANSETFWPFFRHISLHLKCSYSCDLNL